jgi:hypothetical protein
MMENPELTPDEQALQSARERAKTAAEALGDTEFLNKAGVFFQNTLDFAPSDEAKINRHNAMANAFNSYSLQLRTADGKPLLTDNAVLSNMQAYAGNIVSALKDGNKTSTDVAAEYDNAICKYTTDDLQKAFNYVLRVAIDKERGEDGKLPETFLNKCDSSTSPVLVQIIEKSRMETYLGPSVEQSLSEQKKNESDKRVQFWGGTAITGLLAVVSAALFFLPGPKKDKDKDQAPGENKPKENKPSGTRIAFASAATAACVIAAIVTFKRPVQNMLAGMGGPKPPSR